MDVYGFDVHQDYPVHQLTYDEQRRLCDLLSNYVTNLNSAMGAITHQVAEMWQDIDVIAASNKNMMKNLQLCRETKAISNPIDRTHSSEDGQRESVVDASYNCVNSDERYNPTHQMSRVPAPVTELIKHDTTEAYSIVRIETFRSINSYPIFIGPEKSIRGIPPRRVRLVYKWYLPVNFVPKSKLQEWNLFEHVQNCALDNETNKKMNHDVLKLGRRFRKQNKMKKGKVTAKKANVTFGNYFISSGPDDRQYGRLLVLDFEHP